MGKLFSWLIGLLATITLTYAAIEFIKSII